MCRHPLLKEQSASLVFVVKEYVVPHGVEVDDVGIANEYVHA